MTEAIDVLPLCDVDGCDGDALPETRICPDCLTLVSRRTLCALRRAWRSQHAETIRITTTMALLEARDNRRDLIAAIKAETRR